MSRPLRIAHVGPVAMAMPPAGSGSVELMTWLLTEALVRLGVEVTLFATGNSRTSARLDATFSVGYCENPDMWPWELYEMLNLSAAVERATEFDVIHYEAAYYPMSLAFSRVTETPVVQTLHHAPGAAEIALWSRYAEAPFIAVSDEQARLLHGLRPLRLPSRAWDLDNSFCFAHLRCIIRPRGATSRCLRRDRNIGLRQAQAR